MKTITCLLFLFFCGCMNSNEARFGKDRKFPDLNYTGDGKFTDHGRKAGILRFVLDLGEVDLKEAFNQTSELTGLPEVKFVCYLRVDHPLDVSGGPKGEFKAGDTVSEMTLRDQDGNPPPDFHPCPDHRAINRFPRTVIS